MFEAARILTLYAETPVHPGTGATFGAIDLPVQRERQTGFPILPSSSLKGVARAAARKHAHVEEVFGSEVGVDGHAGALSATDGRLLLFPVRSLSGIFVWATCPLVLERLRRDAAIAKNGITLPDPMFANAPADDEVLVEQGDKLGQSVILEDDEFRVDARPGELEPIRTEIARLLPQIPEYRFFRTRLQTHLVVVSDTALQRLTMSGTDVVTRNKLDDATKTTTAGDGNMWVQEYVPAETLFYSLLLAMPSRKPGSSLKTGKEVLDAAKTMLSEWTHLQIGGDESVGRGWMRTHWVTA